ncbi:MAG: energy-coupling factor transporter transmembrane protein EcfT [Tissierellia bacterium]|jgi:energy-coupling factor transport system permease protein|nr:energy-coupling factor transporter transmembrane protein EcfT [Tissierellia bacterium]
MIKDMTLGQYYPVDSQIHRLDPRTKFIVIFVYILAIFFLKEPYQYALLFVGVFGVVRLSKVPLSYILRGLKPILFILLFAFVMNLFLTPGERLWGFWKFNITKEGLRLALLMMARLFLLIMGSSLLTLTTSPIKLTYALESIFSPFAKIGFPVHEMSMMMGIALRFIPTLTAETDKIMKAQMARGADFESGNIFKRARALVPILVPLFLSSIQRAMELADAMEARCYHGGEGRTRFHELRYETRDYIALTVFVLFFGSLLCLPKII